MYERQRSRCALLTGVQPCSLPISCVASYRTLNTRCVAVSFVGSSCDVVRPSFYRNDNDSCSVHKQITRSVLETDNACLHEGRRGGSSTYRVDLRCEAIVVLPRERKSAV